MAGCGSTGMRLFFTVITHSTGALQLRHFGLSLFMRASDFLQDCQHISPPILQAIKRGSRLVYGCDFINDCIAQLSPARMRFALCICNHSFKISKCA